MARTKQTCRKPPIRKHKRLNAFINAYDKLCKTDIKPHSRFALDSTMKQVKSSYRRMIRAYRFTIDKQKNRVREDGDYEDSSSDDDQVLHVGESKKRKFSRDHDSDGDGGAGAGGSGARAGIAAAGIAAGGLFDNF